MKRTCTRCHDTKDISDYSRDSKGKGGFAARCKVCKRGVKKSIKENLERSHKKMGSCCPKKPVSIVALKFISQGNPTGFTSKPLSIDPKGNTPMSKSTMRRLAALKDDTVHERKGMVDTGITFPKDAKIGVFKGDIYATSPTEGTMRVKIDNGHDIEPLLEQPKEQGTFIDNTFQLDQYTYDGKTVKRAVDTMKAINQKFPRHKVLSWGDTKAVFQHMDSPRIVFVGSTVDEVLEKALSY